MAMNWQFLYIHEFLTSRVEHIESSVGNTLIWLWVRSRVVMGPASHAAGGTSDRFFLGNERAWILQNLQDRVIASIWQWTVIMKKCGLG